MSRYPKQREGNWSSSYNQTNVDTSAFFHHPPPWPRARGGPYIECYPPGSAVNAQPFHPSPMVNPPPPHHPNILPTAPNVSYPPPANLSTDGVAESHYKPSITPNTRFPPPLASQSPYHLPPMPVTPHVHAHTQLPAHALLPQKPVGNPPCQRQTSSAEEKLRVWLTASNLSKPYHVQPSTPNNLTLLDIKVMLHRLNVLRLKLKAMTPQKEMSEKNINAAADQTSVEDEVKELLGVLEADGTKDMVKTKIMRLQKRKERRKRRRQRIWEESQAKSLQIEKRHEVIDKWLEEIQEQKRMEQMVKAADESMAEVRQKITDIIKQKELIDSLVKLRSIREQTQISTYGSSDGDTKNKFMKKTCELSKLLDKRLEIYRKEEAALKVMLDSEHEESRAKEARILATRRRRQHDKLEKQKALWLFGSHEVSDELRPFYDYYTQADTDFDAFINFRHQWDSFITADGVPGASRVPRGWVVPQEPSSKFWSKYLKQDATCDRKGEAVKLS